MLVWVFATIVMHTNNMPFHSRYINLNFDIAGKALMTVNAVLHSIVFLFFNIFLPYIFWHLTISLATETIQTSKCSAF